MRMRTKLWPRTVGDVLGVLFLSVVVPVCYWFQVCVALPLYFEGNSTMYFLHAVISSLLLVNLVGNLVAVFLVDPSITGRLIPTALLPTWRFCSLCESVTPPRSWHCNICGSCILKRDHHCNFTACCIGHDNQRYFISFLFYLSLSTIYTSYFSGYYLWRFTPITSLYSLLKLILPLAALLLGPDSSLVQLHRLVCVVTMVSMLATTTLLLYHLSNLCRGRTMYEGSRQLEHYDLGSSLANVRLVLGQRWHMALLSPFLPSPLPHDGIHWDQLKLTHSKSR